MYLLRYAGQCMISYVNTVLRREPYLPNGQIYLFENHFKRHNEMCFKCQKHLSIFQNAQHQPHMRATNRLPMKRTLAAIRFEFVNIGTYPTCWNNGKENRSSFFVNEHSGHPTLVTCITSHSAPVVACEGDVQHPVCGVVIKN